MCKVVRLRWAEWPLVQTEILSILQNEVGARSSQDMIERAALELSDRLWLIEKAVFEQDRAEVARLANSMVQTARQIGLSELAHVADALADSCQSANMVAVYAVSARLQRIGEESLQFAVHYQQSAP